MITYPITFEGSAQATEGIQTSWETKATDTALLCSVPKEFEGSSENASPEDYFLLAVMNCFVATFKVYASYSKVSFRDLKVSAKLIVDKNEQGKPCMRKVAMDVNLSGISNPDRARLLVDKVLANGFILQSVKSELVANLTLS
jgi:organic hydroperoxide reductase OsmC/OhrA